MLRRRLGHSQLVTKRARAACRRCYSFFITQTGDKAINFNFCNSVVTLGMGTTSLMSVSKLCLWWKAWELFTIATMYNVQ